jgi:dual specificity tyrosine-phosphorylation-regulated kinase 2/3/4
MLGEPPGEVLEKSTRTKLFFDYNGSPIIKENSRGKKYFPGTKNLSTALNVSDFAFLDFVSGCLEWDPDKRLTPNDAM